MWFCGLQRVNQICVRSTGFDVVKKIASIGKKTTTLRVKGTRSRYDWITINKNAVKKKKQYILLARKGLRLKAASTRH